MTSALLTYTSSPTQVAISASGSTSEVAITFLVVNNGSASVTIEQIVLTIPQGAGSTDLIAANTTFTSGSVHSSNSSSWSLSLTTNQATLAPVSAQGFATLAPGDSLQFTLSGLQINASGAGQTANIAVNESVHNGADNGTQIPIQKIAPGFYIESFYVDQYNVASGSPVTVSWKVVDALSCTVSAEIIQLVSLPERSGPGCGIGTANPACDGTIASGTDFSDSHTCNVQGATVFTLTALGKGGSGDVTLSSQLLVTVNEPAIGFTGYPPTTMLGQSVEIKWIAADAAKLQLYIAPTQGESAIHDITDTPIGSKTLQPLVDTNYYLYAFTNAGDSQPAIQSEFDVIVEQPQWTANLAVSNVPSPAYPGDTVTLDWTVLNVDCCNLTCDLPGFVPQNNLPVSGTQLVTLPDPGVANATATFTMTPVQFGGLGDFAPTSTTVSITNLPHFGQGLAADPASVTIGGPCTLTWAVDHADTAVLTNSLPGTTPQSVDPASTTQVVQIPPLLTSVPTTIDYTLTASRQNQTYSAATSATIQCAANASVSWCRGQGASDASSDYLESLCVQQPNQRIRKIQLNFSYICGVSGILIWYSDGVDPDYSVVANTETDRSASLIIPAGDYLTSIMTVFYANYANNVSFSSLNLIQLATAGGLSVAIGLMPGMGNTDGPYGGTIFGDEQVIAFAWNICSGSFGLGTNTSNYFAGVGLVTCTTAYGQ